MTGDANQSPEKPFGVSPLSLSFKDITYLKLVEQYLAQREQLEQAIARELGIPPHLLDKCLPDRNDT